MRTKEEMQKLIKEEGNIDFFMHESLPCFAIRVSQLNIQGGELSSPTIVKGGRFHLCGYVGVPKNHVLYGKSYSDDDFPSLDVHGGVTFSGFLFNSKDFWFIGFDCSHSGDLWNFGFNIGDETYKDLKYVRKEIEKLAKQISKIKRNK